MPLVTATGVLAAKEKAIVKMKEEWRAITGFPGYEVSDTGLVRSWRGWGPGEKPRLLKQMLNPQRGGCLQVYPCKDGRPKTRKVHRLVLEAFVGPCPKGMEGCHRDGDPTNNRLDNLYWGTSKQNTTDSKLHGTFVGPPHYQGELNPAAKLTELAAKEIREMYVRRVRYPDPASSLALAKKYNVSQEQVRYVARKKHWASHDQRKGQR